MFEAAEVGNQTDKKEYKRQEPKLRTALLAAQKGLAASDFSFVLIVGGVEGAGKTEFVNQLLAWLDARGLVVHAEGKPTDEEREHPYFWRFWRLLPPKRKAAILLTSWYSQPIVDRVFKRASQGELDCRLDQIVDFERMLSAEGVLVVKLWFHISKPEQKRRFKKLEADAQTRWRVTRRDWKFHKRYDRFVEVCEHCLMKTSLGETPWHIVEATDRRYRNLTAARIVVDALQRRVEELGKVKRPDHKPLPAAPAARPDAKNVIRKLDLSKKLDEAAFARKLERLQNHIGTLTRKLHRGDHALTLAFEGPDAAGKGGAIRRLIQAMDARLYRVDSVAAPTEEEKTRPYLWRFWRDLPRLGRVTIYDRSWYGRVLVERVEGFALPAEWKRAYGEINAFEQQLADAGVIVRKFWIAISPEEELKRFKDRQTTPYKQYKLTPEDWRNRAKWEAYEAAACEMIERTSTEHAPWVLVEGNDKRWARIKILQSVADALESEL